MALPIISATDFSGWLKITANSFKQQDLENYISLFREEYLRSIVGDAAFQDISDQTRQKWTDLIEGVNYVDSDNKRQYYKGLVLPLLRFIYFEFIRDDFTTTQTGKVRGSSENSIRINTLDTLNIAISRYNSGIRMINESLPCFLETYDIIEEDITGVTRIDNTYTLDVSSTQYIEEEDVVTIEDEIYDVLSIVENTSITIDGRSPDLDFTNKVVSWEPFKDIEFCDLEPISI